MEKAIERGREFERRLTLKKTKKEAPLCYNCKKPMTLAYDEIAKRPSEHSWHCIRCYPNRTLSVG